MGPQLYRCGNQAGSGKEPPPADRLQWGRNFIVAETRQGDGYVGRGLPLQWGRNFIVAETSLARSITLWRRAASMGPQLYRCGNQDEFDRRTQGNRASMGPQLYRWRKLDFLCTQYQDTIWASMGPQLYRCGNLHWHSQPFPEYGCFNGAATLSLRKRTYCDKWAPLLEASFNGAATLSLRKPFSVSFIAVIRACFNGAATLSLRKHELGGRHGFPLPGLQWGRNFIVAETALRGRRFRVGAHASMGPQLYRCGNILPSCSTAWASIGLQWGRNFIVAETSTRALSSANPIPCFNGAATLSLRKLCHHRIIRIHIYRFNGAATLSLRKLYLIHFVGPRQSALQWGRNFIVAETGAILGRDTRNGWLQWGRNFIVAETYRFDGQSG